MPSNDFYTDAHLVVAAIRVLTHQKSTPPLPEDVCRSLSFSLEHGNFLFNKLQGMEIIDMIEGGYGIRLFVKDHLKLEEIPRGIKPSGMQEELKKFQDSRKGFAQKIESFQAQQAEKQKNLFAELEKKLKKGSDKKPA